ncbi:MAG: Rieske (2Fe-2S) protein [Nocardioidaceae bacterium]
MAGAAVAGSAVSACGGPAASGPPPGSSAGDTAPAGTELGKSSQVAVGGARIFTDARVVVTQPTAGDFQGFSAICTHQGCVVNEISGDAIVCPCHRSRFSTKDGSVLHGPATAPLPARKVEVRHGTLVLG